MAENLWQEVRPHFKKLKPRALIRQTGNNVQVLVEMGLSSLKTTKGGRVVMIAEAEVSTKNMIWLGDRWVKPRVICKVYARFSEQDITIRKRRERSRRNAKNSPVLHTSL